MIRNFFEETGWLFDAMVDVEDRLGAAGYLWDQVDGDGWSTASTNKPRSFFSKRRNSFETYAGRIEDDHLPFLAQGVPILHVIPVPYVTFLRNQTM
jgi:glutaminyl-peptide cyclotransferase